LSRFLVVVAVVVVVVAGEGCRIVSKEGERLEEREGGKERRFIPSEKE
jgi:hypothetical protein